MDNETFKLIADIVLTIVGFLVGRYLLPKIKTNVQELVAQFDILLKYAESYCAYARQWLNYTGPEKMDVVVAKLKLICEEQGITIDEVTLKAIAQKAYDAMKAGQNSKIIIPVEEIKTTSTVDDVTKESDSSEEDK